MTHIVTTLTASLVIAALSTLGDFIWATWLTRHMVVYGVVHGALLFCAVGLVLGVLAARPVAGAAAGALIGAAAAGTFYVVSPLFGYAAMFVVWMGVWVALAALYGRLSAVRIDAGHVHDIHINLHAVAGRGIIAAVASGLAFYAISGIWRPFDPQGWDYLVHFAAWTAAYFPGFAALLLARDAPKPAADLSRT